jgi:hypothetical protein
MLCDIDLSGSHSLAAMGFLCTLENDYYAAYV